MTSLQRFSDRAVLVTGAASGIGRATAERLAAEGASLVLSDVDTGGLDATRESAAAAGADVVAVRADVSDPDDVRTLAAVPVAEFDRLDAVANVAGVVQTSHLADLDLDTWNRTLAINLTGTFLVCQACMPQLLDGGGAIVNVSSTAAEAGHPWMSAYAASKGGVLALSRTLAVEFGRRGVRTNVIEPGSIDTPMSAGFEIPEGIDESLLTRMMALDRARGPEHAASVIAFLASDDAAHLNGSAIRCDGGALS